MPSNLPIWISVAFLLTSIATILLFHYANGKPKVLTGIIILYAIGLFPFVLLPAVVVPIVAYMHVTDIVKLCGKNDRQFVVV